MFTYGQYCTIAENMITRGSFFQMRIGEALTDASIQERLKLSIIFRSEFKYFLNLVPLRSA
jgi:hypothetical protein